MKQFTIFLLLLLFGVCSAGTALAAEAELQILVIGNGFVRGEGIGCSYSCTKSFEKGTVVHLKAIPFPNARFVEWKVDGQSHAGVITIEKDTVVSALFERKTEAPEDELQLTWYNGNSPEHGTIALDEMAVFLEEREKWGVTSEEAYQAAIQEILQTFHPQAELSQIKSKNMLFLKSPEPLSKTQWFETLYSLSDLKYVKYAGPVLYKIPGASWTQIILFDKISVDFPVSYTEEHIRAIEQEYELIRIKSSVLPNSFTYYAGSPLETVEKANRLYKSGVVEYAIPVTSIRMEPTSNIPDDEYFAQQWHLNNTMPAYTGEDINVLPVWEKKIYGTGKNIAIVDDGVEFAHPDLAQNRKPDKVNDPTDPNDDENYHHDFIDEDDDPIDNNPEDMISSDCVSAVHGTAVAGVAASRGFNDIGVSGVAPFANLIGYRTTVGSSGCGYTMGSDGWESVFPWGIQTVDIYNNSWGASEIRQKVNERFYKTMVYGTEKGRKYDGKERGIIYVWSAGNMKKKTYPDVDGTMHESVLHANTNYYSFTNSRYTITVGASGHSGEAHDYSAPGATVVVNAPAGLDTTDRLGAEGYNQSSGEIRLNEHFLQVLSQQAIQQGLPLDPLNDLYPPACQLLLPEKFATREALFLAIEGCIGKDATEQYRGLIVDYLNDRIDDGNYTIFAGTSAAAPVVSGVVALMLEARPDLGWRDVQHILIETAEKNRGEAGDILAQEWQANTNAAGVSHLYKYGFGRVDAAAAVEKAESWTLLPATAAETIEFLNFGLGDILDGDPQGLSSTNPVFQNIKIDFVDIEFTADEHPRWGDLEITLTSPTGASSILAEPVPSSQGAYEKWHFGSWRHFGEPSKGTWHLDVKDNTANGDQCTDCYYTWVLTMYGDTLPTWTLTTPTESTCQEQNGGVVCSFTDGSGSVTLTPTGVANPNLHYVFTDAYCEGAYQKYCAPTTTHSGTYWFPRQQDDALPQIARR